jgi:hypothetical protein
MGSQTGVKIGQDEQAIETNSGFQPFEMIVPNDLFQAYSIHAKIEGKLPENAKLRFRTVSYFKTFDWDKKHN